MGSRVRALLSPCCLCLPSRSKIKALFSLCFPQKSPSAYTIDGMAFRLSLLCRCWNQPPFVYTSLVSSPSGIPETSRWHLPSYGCRNAQQIVALSTLDATNTAALSGCPCTWKYPQLLRCCAHRVVSNADKATKANKWCRD